MSAKAMGWTFEHSPYKGVSFTIHLAVADVVNDTYENKLWANHATIAAKARTTRESVARFLSTAIKDGLIELVEHNHGAGMANVYAFMMPEGGVTRDHTLDEGGCDEPSRGGVMSDHKGCDEPSQEEELKQELKKGTTTSSSDASGADPEIADCRPVEDEDFAPIEYSDDVVALCEKLGDHVDAHYGAKKNRGKSWLKDMDLLLRRGPLGWTDEPPSPEKVGKLIDWIFSQEPRNGFCWADNIQSPAKLRQQYIRLRKEANDSVRGRGRGATTLDQTMDAIDRVFGPEDEQ